MLSRLHSLRKFLYPKTLFSTKCNGKVVFSESSLSKSPIKTSETSSMNDKLNPYLKYHDTKSLSDQHICPFVRLEAKGSARIITLNRPKSLHALNADMIDALTEHLRSCESNPACSMVILTADNSETKSRSFSAGGDVVAVTQGDFSVEEKISFFQREYILNHYIGTYSKPIIAIMDGIVMGGGAGLAIHCPVRVGTEFTRFGMPENRIGFFPDVGSSFFLSRLPSPSFGRYLAITGKEVRGGSCLTAGITTNHVRSAVIPDLLESLGSFPLEPKVSFFDRLKVFLEPFSQDPGPFSFQKEMSLIEKCFSEKTHSISTVLGDMLQSKKDDPLHAQWAGECLDILSTLSPTSIAVTLYMMSHPKSFADSLQQDFALASSFIQSAPDFKIGVHSRLVLKSKVTPEWTPLPANPLALFNAVEKPLVFLKNIDFNQYPNHAFSPSKRFK